MFLYALPFTMASKPIASFKSETCSGISQISSSQSCNTPSANNAVSNIVSMVVNILSILVGSIAVIMIIIAGLKYVTANGDTNKIASAKSALIYAIVGLVIAAVAYALANNVFNSAKSVAYINLMYLL